MANADTSRDEHHNLISMLHHLLESATTLEQSIHEAEEQGDQELVQFFTDWRDEQRHFSERAKNLLSTRMSRMAASEQLSVAERSALKHEKDVTNANVKSGGNSLDDAVDEQSKESFPASDSSAKY
jgi:hypothetical protein